MQRAPQSDEPHFSRLKPHHEKRTQPRSQALLGTALLPTSVSATRPGGQGNAAKRECSQAELGNKLGMGGRAACGLRGARFDCLGAFGQAAVRLGIEGGVGASASGAIRQGWRSLRGWANGRAADSPPRRGPYSL